MGKSVLALGPDPVFADFTRLLHLNPHLILSFIETQLEELRSAGYGVTGCLPDTGETAEATLARLLRSRSFDCVMFGRRPARCRASFPVREAAQSRSCRSFSGEVLL